MKNNFNKTPHFPFTYGDDATNDGNRLSDYAVNKLSEKKTQNYLRSMVIAIIALGSQAAPVNAIPLEYGEAANEILNQAAQNGAAGGVPAAPPIGQIQAQVPAMPIEQQRLIAAQQMGRIPIGPAIDGRGPTNPPSFYIPGKPRSVVPRAVNTVAFTSAVGIICLNAAWGEPVAILMCSTGLVGVAYRLGKEVVLFMSKNI